MDDTKRKDHYACVYFSHEGTYSCIKSKLFAYDFLEFPNVVDLVGKELPVVWEDNGSKFQAEIIAFGRKRAMNNLNADKALEAANESFEGKQDQLGRGKRVKRKLGFERAIGEKRARKVKAACKTELSRQPEATIRELVENAVGVNCDTDSVRQRDLSIPSAQTPDSELLDVIAEKDKEIKRLQWKLANLTNRAISNEMMRVGQTELDKQVVTVGV